MPGRRLNSGKPLADYQLIRANAEVVFEQSGGKFDFHVNEKSRMTILGVIGQTETEKYSGLGVLMEIGLFRANPYGEIPIPAHSRLSSEPRNFPKRLDCLQISDDQYLQVAPRIFQFLEQRALAGVSNRKCNLDNPFYLTQYDSFGQKAKLTKQYYVRRKRKTYVNNTAYPVLPSLRFSASVFDKQFVNDLYWAELYGNTDLDFRMKQLRSFMELRQSGIKLYKRKRYPKDWRQYGGFNASYSSFSDIYGGTYLGRHFIEHYMTPNDYFYDEYLEYQGWERGVLFPEQEFASRSLPGHDERLQGIQIRIVRRTEKYVVFDVAPRKPEEEIPF